MTKKAIFIFLLFPLFALAETYKWTDSEGKVHFSDTAPNHEAERVDLESKVKITSKPALNSEDKDVKTNRKKTTKTRPTYVDQTKI